MANSKRILSCLLVMALLSVFLASTAQTANAGSDYGASTWATHYLGVAADVAAAVALQKLSTQIINKVKNSGPGGGPGFIQNWINFATQAQYQGEGIFRAELSKANLCNYLSSGLKKLFGATGQVGNLVGQNIRTDNLDSFGVRVNCTMPSGFNLANYQKDFAGNGGWDAFSRMLQPQNNYYGALFKSLGEVGAQRALAEKSNTAKATAGGGFFGFGEKDCKLLVANNCLIPGNTKTPGSIVARGIADALKSPADSLSSSKSDIIATTAISALTTWVVNKLFNLLDSSPDPADNSKIPSAQRTADSYKQEFCMAENNMSPAAMSWIKANYPQAWIKYPVSSGGKSYCEGIRKKYDKNSYPYSRCTETCMEDLGGLPATSSLPPAKFSPEPLPPEEGGVCTTPPTDGDTRHGNHQAEVAAAKAELVSQGLWTWTATNQPAAGDTVAIQKFECDRFAISNLAAKKIGGGAGIWSKPGLGTNCQGYSTDIVAFSDGYIYDVLVGTDPAKGGDGAGPGWSSDTCLPLEPNRYRPAI